MAGIVIALGLGIGGAVGAGMFGATGAAVTYCYAYHRNAQAVAAANSRVYSLHGVPCVIDNGYVSRGGVLAPETKTALVAVDRKDGYKLPVTFLDPMRFDKTTSYGACASQPVTLWVCDGRAALTKERVVRAVARRVWPMVHKGLVVGVVLGGIIGACVGATYTARVLAH